MSLTNVEFTSLEQLNCFLSRLGNCYDCTGIFQNAFEQRASIYFVVYHENTYAFNLNVNISYARGRNTRVTTFGPRFWVAMHNRKRQGDDESRSKPRSIAFDANRSAMKFDQLPDNRKTKSKAAMAT